MSDSIKSRLLGTWKLISNEFKRSNGEIFYPLGKDTQGLLIYDDVYMSVQLMTPNRPQFLSQSQFKGDIDEIRAAFTGYTAYYGTYEIVESEKKLIHFVEGSLYPNWVGGEQIRYYDFHEDQLILRPSALKVKGDEITGFLLWQKKV